MPEREHTNERDPEEVLDESAVEGTETEEDLGSVDPAQFGRAIVSGTDWTADTIITQLAVREDLFPRSPLRDKVSLGAQRIWSRNHPPYCGS
jgi:hypothetical protein